LWCDFSDSSGDVPRLQTFEADFEGFGVDYVPFRFRCFNYSADFNYFIINILIQFIMTQVHLLGANRSYDTSKQVLNENQIVVHHGMGASVTHFVVYRVEHRYDDFIYHLINIETKAFSQTDLPRPLSEKFGIGMYYNDQTPEFMDTFEVLALRSEAEYKAKAEQEERQTAQQATTITIPTAITGDFLIVDYSQKALAIFGDTRTIKDQLKALNGRFNPKLTHEGSKKAGWIFSKSKEQELMNLLTIK
jgi:hypothetical protein